MRRFGFDNFLLRWLLALVVVFATFNPSGYSYAHWISTAEGGQLPLKVLVGVVLAILYVIYLRATWRSIGPVGAGLALALLGALVWVFVDFGWLSFEQSTVMTYIGLLILATVLGIGLSWSHVRRRVSGQADVDDIEQ